MRNYLIVTILVLVLVGGLVVYSSRSKEKEEEAVNGPKTGSDYANPLVSRIGNYATSGTIFAITTSRVVLATSTTRTYVDICNTTPSASVMLSFGETAAFDGTGSGHFLAPNTCYEIIPGKNLFTGTIEAIASSSQATQVPLSVTANQ